VLLRLPSIHLPCFGQGCLAPTLDEHDVSHWGCVEESALTHDVTRHDDDEEQPAAPSTDVSGVCDVLFSTWVEDVRARVPSDGVINERAGLGGRTCSVCGPSVLLQPLAVQTRSADEGATVFLVCPVCAATTRSC
jgi:DNA-directed RNA polymerase subunit M/transcription elongation factor TFIIS